MDCAKDIIVDFSRSDFLPNLFLDFVFSFIICIFVASCKRTFLELKLIETHLRTTMSQSQLINLAILSIENNVNQRIRFEEGIDKFAATKVRKS